MKKLAFVLLFAVQQIACNAFVFNRVPAGQINGTRQVYLSPSAVKLTVGYGEIMGAYWEVAPDDPLVTTGYSLTDLSVSTNGVFHYIYIDRLSSSLPKIALRNSTVSPVWNDDFMGWYDGTDRCIGALWINSDGTIRSFFCPDDGYYVWASVTSIARTLPASYDAWTLLDVSDYLPANTREALVETDMWGTSVVWNNCRAGISSESSSMHVADGVVRAKISVLLPFQRSSPRRVRWMAYAALANTSLSTTGMLFVRVSAYRIER